MWIFFSCVTLVFATVYEVIASFVLLFVPRYFRRKKKIRGQNVLITGAGNGIGRHLAIEFSKRGTCVILVDIDRPALLQTQKLLDPQSTSFIYECDVSDYKKVYEMAKKARLEAGDVDILVNNAGVAAGKYLLDLPEEKILKTVKVNTLAHFWTVKAFLPSMMEKNRGHLVSIVSILAKSGAPKLTDYCASKSAALGFAEAVEMELREQKLDGIKVTVVLPALVDTELTKGMKLNLGSIMTPGHVAKEVVLGVLEEQESIYIPSYIRHVVKWKEFIPRRLLIKSAEITGSIKAMENYKGRESNNEQQSTNTRITIN